MSMSVCRSMLFRIMCYYSCPEKLLLFRQFIVVILKLWTLNTEHFVIRSLLDLHVIIILKYLLFTFYSTGAHHVLGCGLWKNSVRFEFRWHVLFSFTIYRRHNYYSKIFENVRNGSIKVVNLCLHAFTFQPEALILHKKL